MTTDSNNPGEKLPIPPFLGIATFVVGVFLLTWGPRYVSQREWVWWTGIVLSGVGIVLWIFSGMTRRQAIEWSKSGAIALLFALAFRWAVAEPYRIPSGSMMPTLWGDERIGRGDRVFVNKWVYGVRYPFMNERIWYGKLPQRWDIVVFKSVEENPLHSTLVKRVVGLPGERIHIENGQVYANGQPLELPGFMPKDQRYTQDGIYGVRTEDEFSVVPPGHYLVMGDNSRSSRDGRYFGWLPNEHIVGRVASIWWPPQSWRDFTGFSQKLWWKALVVITSVWLIVRIFIGRSWPYHPLSGAKRFHLFISFLSMGLRIPFTRWWGVHWGAPQRGDIVLYHPPAGGRFASDVVLAGRIAALPGEKIAIEKGKLLVNGGPPIDAPPVADLELNKTQVDATFGRTRNKEFSQVPAGHYFILSEEDETGMYDSRSLGWVPRKRLLGKALSIWWPPQKWELRIRN
ncbi:MAG: signal peptidase I [Candidatus Hydrogenedentes bacterium]|nr:signal peptidase I [Candidatus Hydrogenedentota bacterium]